MILLKNFTGVNRAIKKQFRKILETAKLFGCFRAVSSGRKPRFLPAGFPRYCDLVTFPQIPIALILL
jgi:hypothetical protein